MSARGQAVDITSHALQAFTYRHPVTDLPEEEHMTTFSTNAGSDGHAAEVTIRRLDVDDAAAVRRLAQRDSSQPPAGLLLGAELDGRLRAAISATSGEVVADPFYRTAELVETLRLRVGQVDGQPGASRRGLLSRLRRTTAAKRALPARS
jgi:hypothetical protein